MKKLISTMFALILTLALAISANAAGLSNNLKNITKTEGLQRVTAVTQTERQSTTQSTAESRESLDSSTVESPQEIGDESVAATTATGHNKQNGRIANTGDAGLAAIVAVTAAAAAAFVTARRS